MCCSLVSLRAVCPSSLGLQVMTVMTSGLLLRTGPQRCCQVVGLHRHQLIFTLLSTLCKPPAVWRSPICSRSATCSCAESLGLHMRRQSCPQDLACSAPSCALAPPRRLLISCSWGCQSDLAPELGLCRLRFALGTRTWSSQARRQMQHSSSHLRQRSGLRRLLTGGGRELLLL